MRKVCKIWLVTFVALVFYACSNDDNNETIVESLNGTYSGTFTVKYLEDPVFYDQLVLSNDVSIEFENGTFTCSNGENFIPAGGSGEYELHGNKITFNDENAWFANFDWNLILEGEYNIIQKRSVIIISARKGIGLYKYQLTKQ